jgi:hypothetical protein
MGAHIIWVDEGADGFAGWQTLLEGAGHTVERMTGMGTLDQSKIDAMNAADLVIVSRDTNSGGYDDGQEPTQWNALTVPLIQTSAYLARQNRWQWLPGTGTPAINAPMEIIEDHPIFAGVGTAGDTIVMNASSDINVRDTTDAGNGLLLGALADGRVWIVFWEALDETPFHAGTSHFPAAPRMWFAAGDDLGAPNKGNMNLTEDGQTIFLNAVAYMTGGIERLTAYGPDPKNGSQVLETWDTLSWNAGDKAVSHDVYIGTDLAAVQAGDQSVFYASQTGTFVVAGIDGFAIPDGLVPGTTYYWRVDEVNPAEPNSPWIGDVWSFTVPPKIAYDPQPADGMALVPTDVDLTWTAGMNAVLHYVYFGTDADQVANDTGAAAVGVASFDPGDLQLDTTYYWRVDESDGFETQKGDVWSFTTAPAGLVGELELERWTGTIAIDDLRSLIDNGTRAPDETETLTNGFTWDLDLEGYGARIFGWVYAPMTGDYRFNLCTDDNGRLYLSEDQDPARMVEIARETSYLGVGQFPLAGDQRSDPIPLIAGEKYYIEAIWQEGTGGDHCQVAWTGPGIGDIPTIIASSFVSPFNPVQAYGASPGNRSVDVSRDTELRWKAGKHATSHDVYFGTDADAVANATKASTEFKGTKALGDEKYDPGVLDLAQTYYWRIDEANALHPDSPWTGSVWKFTVGDFVVIDDIEDYNNFSGYRIFETWIDGWGNPANGSIMGHLPTQAEIDAGATFVETGTVHSGDQSMPFYYDNNMKYSEVTRVLPAHLSDWTQEGVRALSMWYYGRAAPLSSFVEGPVGTYSMTAEGWDIWGNEDGMHFAWKILNGPGSITARVDSVERAVTGDNNWLKTGVMIRETLDPNSMNAFSMVSTNSSRVRLQVRVATADTTSTVGEVTNITIAPHWIKLERDFSGNFTASHANDVGGAPDQWTEVASTNIQMSANTYVGLALTSHSAGNQASAVFSNVTITGTVTGTTFTAQDIGVESNGPEPMFVSIKDTAGRTATVYNTDPNAANVTDWAEWGQYGQGVALTEFTAQTPGLNLTSIDTISLGFGTKGNTQPGGGGLVFFDDIRLYKSRCIPELAKPLGDLSNNCVVDLPDVELLSDAWLTSGPDIEADLNADEMVDFMDYALLTDAWLDEVLWP